MVYVLSIDGKPLMPTSNAKARILLKQKKVKRIMISPNGIHNKITMTEKRKRKYWNI